MHIRLHVVNRYSWGGETSLVAVWWEASEMPSLEDLLAADSYPVSRTKWKIIWRHVK